MPDSTQAYPRDFFNEPTSIEQTGYILMPFRSELAPVHDAIAAGITGAGLTPVRADQQFNTKAAIIKILEGIGTARVVVADLTGLNTNVVYEVGIAHTVKDNVVLVTQDDPADGLLPFDVRHIDVKVYRPDEAGLSDLSAWLAGLIRRLPLERGPFVAATEVVPMGWDGRTGLAIRNVGPGSVTGVVVQVRHGATGFQRSRAPIPHMRADEDQNVRELEEFTPEDAGEAPEFVGGTVIARVTWVDQAEESFTSAWTQFPRA